MSEITKAIYPGTFDPFTNGHADILRRALLIFNEVTLLIAVHPSKKSLFTKDEKVEMLNEIYKNNKRVHVDFFEGLSVDYAENNKANAIVRGLRPTGDFESEYQMASMNNKLNPNIETVFLMTGGDHNFISSSLVREVHGMGGKVSSFVPDVVMEKLSKKI